MKISSIVSWFVFIIGYRTLNFCYGVKTYERYLSHIFKTYGNGEAITFEGLEHLLFNLGLGELEFSHSVVDHYINGSKASKFELENLRKSEYGSSDNMSQNYINITLPPQINSKNISHLNGFNFKSMHDSKHRHPRNHDYASNPGKNCLSPRALIKMIIGDEGRSKRNQPSAIYGTLQQNDPEKEDDLNNKISSYQIKPIDFIRICPALLVQIDEDACMQSLSFETAHTAPFSPYLAILYASAAIFIISVLGVLSTFMIPKFESPWYNNILKFLIAMAIGTLCGDAFLHLLPHAIVNETESKDHNYSIWICFCTVFVAVLMYTTETMILLSRKSEHHNHCHTSNPQKSNTIYLEIQSKDDDIDTAAKENYNMIKNENIEKQLSSTALMVILGDGLHNFTDGMAIGAAFAAEPVTGIATAFAILCHELPHELGDFALLLKSGVKMKKAIFLNILSSIFSFIGMAVGFLVAGINKNMFRWIYAGTAGSFIYIAFVDLLPEINSESKNNFKSAITAILGILLGCFIMLIIAIYEDNLVDLLQ